MSPPPTAATAARYALDIPHILDAVLEAGGDDDIRCLLHVCRLVCKRWDEACLARLAEEVSLNVNAGVGIDEPESYLRILHLDGILDSRPQLIAKIRHLSLVNLSWTWEVCDKRALFVRKAVAILDQSQRLESLTFFAEEALDIALLRRIPQSVRCCRFKDPFGRSDQVNLLEAVTSLPHLVHLSASFGFIDSVTQTDPANLSRLLQPLCRRLISLELDFTNTFNEDVGKTLEQAEPYLRHLRRLTLKSEECYSRVMLDCLPQSLQLLEVQIKKEMWEQLLDRLADPRFLPNLIRLPVVRVEPETDPVTITKAEIREALEGLRARGGVQDLDMDGASWYRLADDLAPEELERLEDCERDGVSFTLDD